MFHDFPVYWWNKGSGGKQMPEGDVWSILTAGKAGRGCSLKPRGSAQKNVTKETFLVSIRHEVLSKSFSMVKVHLCHKLEWDNRWACTATFFSSAGRTVRSILFYWLQNTTQEVCVGLVRNLQEASICEPTVPFTMQVKSEFKSYWGDATRSAYTCDSISSFRLDSSLQEGGNTSAHTNSW